MRSAIAVLLLITSAACDTRLVSIATSLSVEPRELQFSAATAVGDTRREPLVFTNGSRAPLKLHLSSPAPFALELDVKLGGGESRPIDIPFAPVELGGAAATLQVSGDVALDVPLSAEAVAAATC